MDEAEWAGLVGVISQRWLAIDEADALAWLPKLSDLDGGVVASALMAVEEAGEQPSATSIRKHAYKVIRERAAAAPHPEVASGYITFREWLHRGCPGYLPDEPDREKVRAIARSHVGTIGAMINATPADRQAVEADAA